jgi:RHS repeat-associated protein
METPSLPNADAIPSPSATTTKAPEGLPTPPETPTTIPTFEPLPTAEPTITPSPSPEISDKPAPPGTSAEAVIGPEGGVIKSADGRVSIEFPDAAIDEPLLIRITHLDTHKLPPLPDQPFMTAWEFDAFAVDRNMSRVEQFSENVRVSIHYTTDDLIGRVPESLRLWHLDSASNQWAPVPTALDSRRGIQLAEMDHFSVNGEGADEAVQMAPYIHNYETNLHTGTSTTFIPIDVPSGPGGLTPTINLTYDSGRVDAMKDRKFSVGSWAGIGWDLTTGSVKWEAPAEPGGAQRYFLELDGMASEIVSENGVWTPKDGQFFRIAKQDVQIGDEMITEWTVTDKSGVKYLFGGSDNAARYYYEYNDQELEKRYYQWDLRQIVDPHDDDLHPVRIDYAYLQVFEPDYRVTGSNLYVRSSYPDEISYPDGDFTVKFNVSYQETLSFDCTGIGHFELEVRRDTPSQAYPPWCTSYMPFPLITETRQLDSIDVKVDGQLVRRYRMTYTTTTGYIHPSNPYDRDAGRHLLVSLTLVGSDEVSELYTSSMSYEDKHFGYWVEHDGDCEEALNGLNRPYLTLVENGFGGTTSFYYHEEPDPRPGSCDPAYWTREVIERKELSFGAQQPNVRTLYGYDYDSGAPSGPKYYYPEGEDAEYRGFAVVKETDTGSNYAKHYFHTTGGEDEELRTGREYETKVYGADGTRWSRTENTWGVSNRDCVTDSGGRLTNWMYPAQTSLYHDGAASFSINEIILVGGERMKVTDLHTYPQYLTVLRGVDGTIPDTHAPGDEIWRVNKTCGKFAHLDQTRLYPNKGEVDNVVIQTNYEYDPEVGEVSRISEWGTGVLDQAEQKVTMRPYHRPLPTDPYIVTPKWEEVWDTDTPANLLRKTTYFYDNSISPLLAKPTKGDMTAVSQEVGAGSVTGYSAYDDYGNLTAQSERAGGVPAVPGIPTNLTKTVTAYDSVYHVYPVSITKDSPDSDPQDQTTFLSYADPEHGDYVLGKVTTRTEPNGRVTQIRYDTFGRPIAVWDNFDSYDGNGDTVADRPTREFEYHWDPILDFKWTRIWQRTQTGTANKLWQIECFDGFGRKAQTRTSWQNAVDTVEAVEYDSRGFTKWTATYHQSPSGVCAAFDPAKPKTVISYDTLGNVATVTGPDMRSRSEDHNGLTTTFIDEKSHKKVSIQNGFGRTVRVEEYTGSGPYQPYATTTYEYDPLGSLTHVYDALYNQNRDLYPEHHTDIFYDMLGRKTLMDDMDMGSWQYTYDAAGNLLSQTDAKDQVTHMQYDDFGRLTKKSYDTVQNPGVPLQDEVNFDYDTYQVPGDPHYDPSFCAQPISTAVGRMTRMAVGSGITYDCFDTRGRVVKERKRIDNVDYNVARTYDSADRLVDLTYPDGETVRHTYWGYIYYSGRLRMVQSLTYGTTYLGPISYTAKGQLNSIPLGNGLTTTYTYDDRGRVTGIAAGSKQNLAYEYDYVGNVQKVTDTVSPEVVEYTYDELNRLKTATDVVASYVYDEIGRIQQFGDMGTSIYQYNSSHVHAVTGYEGEGWQYYFYDENGNMTEAWPAQHYTYDAENRLLSRPWSDYGDVYYQYDGAGNMVKRDQYISTPLGSTHVWDVYVGSLYEQQWYEGGPISAKKYYWAFGRRIAMRSGSTVSYLLADHLGSTNSVVDSNQSIVQDMRYRPYGWPRRESGSNWTDKKFTGQQKEIADSYLGIYNYGARMYSTVLGRFLSADPLVIAPGDPQMLDRYSYVRNNPMRYTDPSGLCPPGIGDCPDPETPLMSPADAIALNDWYNGLLDAGFTPETAMNQIKLTAFWSQYYIDAADVFHDPEKVDPSDAARREWLTELNDKCPGCYTDARWIPGNNPNRERPDTGGIIFKEMPTDAKQWQPGVQWKQDTVDAATAMRKQGFTDYEIAIMPWSREQRFNPLYELKIPGYPAWDRALEVALLPIYHVIGGYRLPFGDPRYPPMYERPGYGY